MANPKRYRYQVQSAWGVMEDRLEAGAIIIDRFKGYGEQVWQIESEGEVVGGWVGVYLGRHEGAAPEPVVN